MSRTTDRRGAIDSATGDATLPLGNGPKVIAHVCDDIGRWRKGFVLPLGKRYPAAKEQFLAWHGGEATDAPAFELGRIQFVAVGEGLWVANIIGQHRLLTPREDVYPVADAAVAARLGIDAYEEPAVTPC